MSYYNRQSLLDRTVESIRRSAVQDYELIIVDDASDAPVVCKYAKVIRIDKRDKWWHNPCVPYNMGFKEAQGDIIVIQNPECMHYGDILSYVQDNIKPNLYLSFGCYAINEEQTNNLKVGINPDIEDKVFCGQDRNGWYNHSVFRAVGYHFCSAITRHDLELVGGFDERYASGIAYDDDDFIYRVNDRSMTTKIINHPFVIHQYHHTFTYKKQGWHELHERNKNIFTKLWL
jgi:glycosyltransferase involved in cell wall biosynthesis